MKKLLAVAIIVLFIGASVVPSTGMVEISNNGRAILYVGGSGPGNYTSIQAAIDDASDGDTVFVFNGTYYESITVNKALDLVGEDRNTTIIDGGGVGHVVQVSANAVNISGFTVQNCGSIWNNAGIYITSNYNTISDNNVVLNGNFGIWLDGSHSNIISYSNLSSNGNEGISFYSDSSKNNVLCNIIVSNEGSGINLKDTSSNNIISGNIISSNNWSGINLLHSSNNNTISGNTISSHDNYGIRTRDSSSNNIIYHNNLINNIQNGYDENTNTWFNETLQEGNYWDDYNGTDNDGDGIGDIPYNISGGSNQDLYPLMYPWYPTHPDTVYIDDDYDNSTPGWGYDRFNRIQYGINEVEGSTVYVYNGTYYENVDIIKDGINLIGENKNSTIIDGIYNIGSIIMIENHNYVNISRFSIRNAQHSESPLEGNGILFFAYSHGANGVTVNNNIISDCKIYNSSRHGISFASHDSWNQKSNNNSIINCEIYSNGYNGIRLNADETCVVRNTIILSSKIYNNGMSEGPPVGYRTGISFSAKGHVSNTLISECDFYDNHHCGVFIERHPEQGTPSNNNIIYHNNFWNDTNNAYDECNNTWDNGYPSGGNYWDDYTGDDLYSGPNQDILGSDGIGDKPYNISGGDNQDMYPCMEPNGWINSPPNIPDRPSGEVIVLPGVEQTYTTSTIDLDSDSIWFKWDWGDGTYTDWLGPYDSGEEASATASWSQGTYQIRVKAKDNRNPETEWSESLTVNIIYPNFETVFLFGQIVNLNESSELSSFNAVKLLWINFNPIFPQILTSNEAIVVSNKYFGILRPSFIFGFFNAMMLT